MAPRNSGPPRGQDTSRARSNRPYDNGLLRAPTYDLANQPRDEYSAGGRASPRPGPVDVFNKGSSDGSARPAPGGRDGVAATVVGASFLVL